MNDIRVLGIGSPFGDDQVGWHVVNLLKQQIGPDSGQLLITACDRPGTRILELMRSADKVFLIDAVMTGAPAGTLHYLKNEEIISFTNGLSTHGIGIIDAIEIGKALNELPKQIILYGIEIENVSKDFKLSKTLRRSIEETVDGLVKEIHDLLKIPK
ncbi:hydrogenase maturation protease [Legionella israelensis]|uniref:Hydrogenase expression/formation protein n=1 Tax=Legionella israelensis TaxID=454 RepID=A0A0W0V332_9GAMM|nr:hydrogenase maturation protease [Legionella israelensis]KTD14105.1 hydrogenase expression/formation protein [Legionella israelensis]QBS10330.1 hydrogenase maturation protease [Legionella israelensis]SCY34489.1 hydrogenase maturation protease [Legionella israelensis DSM 19235]STX59931.1 hydrogenase expression/formation protein [Legionella israelensis]